jgi:hypothetical protein
MPSTSGTRRLAAALGAAALTLGSAPATVAQTPVLVSPGAESAAAVTEARCPTFSWGGVPDAPGYELAVFRLTDDPAEEPALVMRVTLPPDSRSFTPSVGQCLTRGQRYAWSVAARPGEGERAELGWAPAYVFEVETAEGARQAPPEAARRFDRSERAEAFGALAAVASGGSRAGERGGEAGTARDRRPPRAAGALAAIGQPLIASTSGFSRTGSAATAPSLGPASLSVSGQVHLGSSSSVFKDGDVFVWDDATGNTALGRSALSSVSGTAYNNTAFGSGALESTVGGAEFEGSYNTATGTVALQANTTGRNNTATGAFALLSNTTGYSNTALGTSALIANTNGRDNTAAGFFALGSNVTGRFSVAIGARALESNGDSYRNTAVGYRALGKLNSNGIGLGWRNIALGDRAGLNLTDGSSNIFIGNQGQSYDFKTIRIGYTSASQVQGHNKVFIAGISGAITAPGAVAVVVDANGQLGTVLSSRDLKQDVRDLGTLADRLLELRPVSFRYKQHVASDPEARVEFGLIAEEVAEVFPELVVYDEDGKPQTVKYHLLSSLLLGELQRMHRRLEELESRAGVTAPDPGKRRRRSSGRTASERRNDRTLEGARE